MAFQVSKSSHNLRTKHYFARIKIQENIVHVEAYRNSYLHLIAAVAVYTDRQTQTHYRIPRLRMRICAHAHIEA